MIKRPEQRCRKADRSHQADDCDRPDHSAPAARPVRRSAAWPGAGLVVLGLCCGSAKAATWQDLTDLPEWNALKSRWAKAGVQVSLSDAEEVWGIPVGGVRPSTHYLGMTTADVVFDPARMAGERSADGLWGTFEVSALDIRGKPFSNYPLYAFNQTSGIEADPNLRLYELAWAWQSRNGKFGVRIGKLDLSQDFMGSDTAQNFLNGSFGWPMLPSNNLYDQGPVAPLAAPAVRISLSPWKKWHLKLAVSDDNPVGAQQFENSTDPWQQNKDPSGTKFWFGTGAFIIGEVDRDVSFGGHDGTWKAGFFADTGRFPLQSDSDVTRRGNWAVYLVLDHTLVKETGQGALKGFVRWDYTALSDRNQMASTLDAGIVLDHAFHRDGDSLGLGFGYGAPGRYDRETTPTGSVRDMRNEYHIELTYTSQACSWLSVQPDVQGLITPGGGVYDQLSGKKAANALIFGLHLGISL